MHRTRLHPVSSSPASYVYAVPGRESMSSTTPPSSCVQSPKRRPSAPPTACGERARRASEDAPCPGHVRRKMFAHVASSSAAGSLSSASPERPAEQALSSMCPVCMQTLQDPRLLPCLHSLCKACLDQLVTRCLQINPPASAGAASNGGGGGSAGATSATSGGNGCAGNGGAGLASAASAASASAAQDESHALAPGLHILCPVCRRRCSVSGGRQGMAFPADFVSRHTLLQSCLGLRLDGNGGGNGGGDGSGSGNGGGERPACGMCDEAVRQPVAAQCRTCLALLCAAHACAHPLSRGSADHIVQDLQWPSAAWSGPNSTAAATFALSSPLRHRPAPPRFAPPHSLDEAVAHHGSAASSATSSPVRGDEVAALAAAADGTRLPNSDSSPDVGRLLRSSTGQPALHFDICRTRGHDGEPLRLFCRPCDKFICFECFSEEHMLHNCVSAKSMIEYKRRKIQESLEALRDETLPEYEEVAGHVLLELDLLESKTKSVREEIREAIGDAVVKVKTFGERLLQQVEDIEDTRSKLLFLQHEEVVRHVGSMHAAVQFTDMALQHCIGVDLLPVCTLLQDRLDELRLSPLTRKPCESSCLVFKTPLLEPSLEDFVGVVANSLTAARYSRVEGSGLRRAMPRKAARFTVSTYNLEGERVGVGGDKLTAKWITRESCDSDTVISLPIARDDDVPDLTVIDEKNGTYTLKYTLKETGAYMLSLAINNEMLPESPFHIDCSHWCFEADSCTENILLLSNRREAVKVKGSMNNDFLVGNCPLIYGKHKWRVLINTAPYWVAVGITRKPAYDRSASWGWSSVAHQLPEGQELDLMCDRWQEKDLLVMELDCEQRSLRMTNTRSGRHQTISNLPDAELFPWFVLYKQGDSIRIEADECEMET